MATQTFADRLLDWHRVNGRHDLPWQQDRSLYRVWVSEIMLQQTQVTTVIPYFEKFMQRFADIKALASAAQDEVMRYWAGLGYYSRARNLHRAAQLMVQQHDGEFPQHYDEVLALPGIGPSTAGAILAQSLGQRHAILDGNVKRVLARYRMIAGWSGQPQTAKRLWQLAEQLTPHEQLTDYTQAIMDLGATVCTRSSPACELCPLAADCMACQQNRMADFPAKKPKKAMPVRQKRLLIIRNPAGQYLLEKRPPSGIWGGLWSLPELALDEPVDESVWQNWQLTVSEHNDREAFRHTFSHFHLDITPCEVVVALPPPVIADDERFQWHADISALALAAPVSTIFQLK